jgi:amino-acid N-acetyltransferase
MSTNLQAEQYAQFVDWLHAVAPYVHAFRGKTFVVAFGGELVEAGMLNSLVQDLSLLNALGVKLVVVHGSRPQMEAQLHLKGVEAKFDRGLRITDSLALECAKEASGEIRLDIEAFFSQGLPNTPMQHSQVRVISGNFVTARPVGIIDGVDFLHTGYVRKVDDEGIASVLRAGSIVLLSPLGFSATGEAFNLSMEDVAASTAAALHADKLIFLTETPTLADEHGQPVTELAADLAERVLETRQFAGRTLSDPQIFFLRHCLRASKSGVQRAHMVPFSIDGSVLLEIFTHDGVGTMVTQERLEYMREATIDDVGGILQLIEPLEADGTLVKRGRDRIEREIDHYSVLEHDGVLFGCAALYPFPEEKMGELACLTVHADWQGTGEGERIAKHMENRARAAGLDRLFVLTTRTAHWFLKRGYAPASVDVLPKDRQRMYNWSRKSQVFIKKL